MGGNAVEFERRQQVDDRIRRLKGNFHQGFLAGKGRVW